jgi:YgiT-type zinc finger domain-containing protein
MDSGWAFQEGFEMKCRVCTGNMEERVTDLPFKVGDASIVIVRSLPVLQCRHCGETELRDVEMAQVDRLLATVDRSSELEVVRYAA